MCAHARKGLSFFFELKAENHRKIPEKPKTQSNRNKTAKTALEKDIANPTQQTQIVLSYLMDREGEHLFLKI